MRKICSSANTLCSRALSALAESTSVPNGFSRITFAPPSARPARPIASTIESIAAGGIDR